MTLFLLSLDLLLIQMMPQKERRLLFIEYVLMGMRMKPIMIQLNWVRLNLWIKMIIKKKLKSLQLKDKITEGTETFAIELYKTVADAEEENFHTYQKAQIKDPSAVDDAVYFILSQTI